MVEEEILKDRPVRNGRKMPVEASDFTAKSALFLPEMAQFDYLVNLPENVASLGLLNVSGQTMGRLLLCSLYSASDSWVREESTA